MNSGDANNVSAVAVRPPPFWKDAPQLWFCRLESQFDLAGITLQKTKFNYVLSVLDGDLVRIVSDIIRNPHAEEPYNNLKSELIKRLSASEETKLNRLLSDLTLGDRHPSQLLREMRELGEGKVSEELLRSLWLQRLPDHSQAILSCNPGSLAELANCADKIMDVYNKPDIFACSTSNPQKSLSITDHLELLSKQIADLNSKIEPLLLERHSRSKSRKHFKSRSSSRGDVSNLCWYHKRFGLKASKCIKPCSFNEHQSKN